MEVCTDQHPCKLLSPSLEYQERDFGLVPKWGPHEKHAFLLWEPVPVSTARSCFVSVHVLVADKTVEDSVFPKSFGVLARVFPKSQVHDL